MTVRELIGELTKIQDSNLKIQTFAEGKSYPVLGTQLVDESLLDEGEESYVEISCGWVPSEDLEEEWDIE